MKVLNVNYLLDPVAGGGMAERTIRMSRALAGAGIECTILCLDIGLTSECINDLSGIKIIAFPCLLKRFFIPKISFRSLRNVVNEVDIIHIMGHWSVLNALVYLYARKFKKPYVVCPAGALPIYGRSKLFKMIYNYFIGKKIISNAAGFIAVTESEKNHFLAYQVDLNKITVIPNGIDIDENSLINDNSSNAEYGLPNSPYILFVGRLNSIKGPDLLLQAFCQAKDKLSNYHLVFAGPDEGMLANLKEIALDAGIQKRVHFFGYLGGKAKTQALRSAALVAIPSRSEAMSIVVLEAGIYGIPVLLTDQCGFNVINSIAGGLAVEASVEGLQNGLIEILPDREKLKSLGNNLYKYVRARFAWPVIVNQYIKLYGEILKQR
ncbi:MAG: glycosyltransferase [Candidatus Vogelbacteria bacterium]|nr:glycosyltransferase [Candidatus Vogelbacteria bacterium]